MLSRNKKLFLAGAVAILALAAVQGLRTDNVLKRLEAEGFRADLRIDSVPPLVIDRQRRQLALLYPDRARRLRFDEVEGWAVVDRSGFNERPPRYLALRLRGESGPVRLQGPHEVDLKRWADQLDGVLGGR